MLRSSWKFKHFCSDSMIKELSHSVWAYLREDKPTAMLSFEFILLSHELSEIIQKLYHELNLIE